MPFLSTNRLLPGYTLQGTSLFRGQLHYAGGWVKAKNHLAGRVFKVPALLLSKTSEYGEVPFRIVEDSSLLIINLIVASFNKKCSGNVNACRERLWNDLKDALVTGLVLSTRLITNAVAIYHLYNAVTLQIDLKKTGDYHFLIFYRLQAIRVHGYANIKKFEKLASFEKCWKTQATDLVKLYKRLAGMKPDQFETFYEQVKEKFNEKTNPGKPRPQQWECPEDLRNDKSPAQPYLFRILSLSDGMDPSRMHQPQAKAYLCNLLNIPIGSSDNYIKKQYRLVALVIHPDKNQSPHATSATQALNAAWKSAGI